VKKGNTIFAGLMILLLSVAEVFGQSESKQIIVKFKQELVQIDLADQIAVVGIPSVNALNQKYKVRSISKVIKTAAKFEARHRRFGLTRIYLLSVKSDADIEVVCADYQSNPFVEYAQPNRLYQLSETPNDPSFNLQWGLHNYGQTGGTEDCDIDAPEAWDLAHGGYGTTIAIIDTGVDYDHPDLAVNIWVNDDEIPGNGEDDDENGYVDDYWGWDFSDNDNNPMDDWVDGHGHGTHCSGIASVVTNNSTGVAGTSWGCSVMPVKIFPSAYDYKIYQAMVYAADNGARVLSNSWGRKKPSGWSGPPPPASDTIEDAIDYAVAQDCVVVFAANNDNLDEPLWGYPASYSPAIAVAATDDDDVKASFSNYGDWVDVSAPGVNIYSTLWNDTYDYKSGTSMSAPFVSGLAGLIRSVEPGWTNTQVRDLIEDSTDNIDAKQIPKYRGKLGTGRINARNALDVIFPPAAPTDLVATEGNMEVSLDWDDNTEPDLEGYNVHRGETTGGPYTKINSATVTVGNYTDTSLTGGATYYYVVTAIDTFDNESGSSNEVGATPTMVVLSSFTAMTGDSRVILLWRTEVEMDNAGFDIYRSDTRDGNYTKIAFVPGAQDPETSNDYQFTDKQVQPGHAYYYYLEDVDLSGKRTKSDVIQVKLPVAQASLLVAALPIQTEPEILPEQNSLLANYPNPFNPATWIPYNLAEAADVTIQIYDIRGHLIRTLNLGRQLAGFYLSKDRAAYWDGRDDAGEQAGSGVYYYRLSAGNFSATRKMVVLEGNSP